MCNSWRGEINNEILVVKELWHCFDLHCVFLQIFLNEKLLGIQSKSKTNI